MDSDYRLNSKIKEVVFVQLPFPSTLDSNLELRHYYELYAEAYQALFPDYYIPEGLWEPPSWIAFLSGQFRRYAQRLVNLSLSPYSPEGCLESIMEAAPDPANSLLLFSPLAQNLDLTLEVVERLADRGFTIVIGGNMTPVLPDDAGYYVSRGTYEMDQELCRQLGLDISKPEPDYALLAMHFPQTPLLRLFTHHGCIFNCAFCGDVANRSPLQAESKEAIDNQLAQFQRYYPETRILYLGDKTFGQHRPSMKRLKEVFATNPDLYSLIVQTRAEFIMIPGLLDAMLELNVKAVELGFETASPRMRKLIGKPQPLHIDDEAIKKLNDQGLKVVLNVLTGLPWETEESYEETLGYLHGCEAWLFNLYNFVPYPLTRIFRELFGEGRIIDWDWKNWREDAVLVYEPHCLSREAHWKWYLRILRAITKRVSQRLAK